MTDVAAANTAATATTTTNAEPKIEYSAANAEDPMKQVDSSKTSTDGIVKPMESNDENITKTDVKPEQAISNVTVSKENEANLKRDANVANLDDHPAVKKMATDVGVAPLEQNQSVATTGTNDTPAVNPLNITVDSLPNGPTLDSQKDTDIKMDIDDPLTAPEVGSGTAAANLEKPTIAESNDISVTNEQKMVSDLKVEKMKPAASVEQNKLKEESNQQTPAVDNLNSSINPTGTSDSLPESTVKQSNPANTILPGTTATAAPTTTQVPTPSTTVQVNTQIESTVTPAAKADSVSATPTTQQVPKPNTLDAPKSLSTVTQPTDIKSSSQNEPKPTTVSAPQPAIAANTAVATTPKVDSAASVPPKQLEQSKVATPPTKVTSVPPPPTESTKPIEKAKTTVNAETAMAVDKPAPTTTIIQQTPTIPPATINPELQKQNELLFSRVMDYADHHLLILISMLTKNLNKLCKEHRNWKLFVFSLVKSLNGHIAPVNMLASASYYVFSGSSDGKIKAWDSRTWRCEKTLNVSPLPDKRNHVAASAPPNMKMSKAPGRKNTGMRAAAIHARAGIQKLEDGPHPSGEPRGEQVIPVTSLTVHQKFLFMGLEDGRIVRRSIYGERDNNLDREIKAHHGAVRSIAVSKNRVFTGGADGVVGVFAMEDLKLQTYLQKHTDIVTCLALNGNRLFSGSNDETIQVWSSTSLKHEANFKHDGRVTAICSHESRIYSAGWDCVIKIWGARSLKPIKTVYINPIGICWSLAVRTLKGQPPTLVCGVRDADIEIRELNSKGNLRVLSSQDEGRWSTKLACHDKWVKAVLPLPDGRIVSASADWSVKVWNYRGAPPPPQPQQSMSAAASQMNGRFQQMRASGKYTPQQLQKYQMQMQRQMQAKGVHPQVARQRAQYGMPHNQQHGMQNPMNPGTGVAPNRAQSQPNPEK